MSNVDTVPRRRAQVEANLNIVLGTASSPTKVEVPAGVQAQVDVVVVAARALTAIPDVLVRRVAVNPEHAGRSPGPSVGVARRHPTRRRSTGDRGGKTAHPERGVVVATGNLLGTLSAAAKVQRLGPGGGHRGRRGRHRDLAQARPVDVCRVQVTGVVVGEHHIQGGEAIALIPGLLLGGRVPVSVGRGPLVVGVLGDVNVAAPNVVAGGGNLQEHTAVRLEVRQRSEPATGLGLLVTHHRPVVVAVPVDEQHDVPVVVRGQLGRVGVRPARVLETHRERATNPKLGGDIVQEVPVQDEALTGGQLLVDGDPAIPGEGRTGEVASRTFLRDARHRGDVGRATDLERLLLHAVPHRANRRDVGRDLELHVVEVVAVRADRRDTRGVGRAVQERERQGVTGLDARMVEHEAVGVARIQCDAA